jgi:hypothetical protein
VRHVARTPGYQPKEIWSPAEPSRGGVKMETICGVFPRRVLRWGRHAVGMISVGDRRTPRVDPPSRYSSDQGAFNPVRFKKGLSTFDRRTALPDAEGDSNTAPVIEGRTNRIFCWLRSTAAVLGPVILGVIIFATLCPNHLRPRIGESADAERFLAFTTLCGAYAFAYPRSWYLVLCLILLGDAALEATQNLLPDRHGTFADFVTKAFGSIAGAVIANILGRVARLIKLDQRFLGSTHIRQPRRVCRTECGRKDGD